MRNATSEFLTALNRARTKGIVPRKLVWVTAKNRATGDPEGVGMWTGDDNVTISVQDGQTGEMVNRLYIGMGTALKVPTIPRSSKLDVNVLALKMSQLSDVTQLLVREYDPRFAKVDIHEVLLSDVSRLLVPNPVIAFLGEVDGDPIETPAVNAEGSITLEIVSDAIRSLTRTNPTKRSYQAQLRRSGDEFGLYGNVTANWEIAWGE